MTTPKTNTKFPKKAAPTLICLVCGKTASPTSAFECKFYDPGQSSQAEYQGLIHRECMKFKPTQPLVATETAKTPVYDICRGDGKIETLFSN